MINIEALRERGKQIETPHTATAPWVYSPSQLSNFHGCPRRWFFKYMLGYPDKTGPAAELGTKLHAEVEQFFKDGTEPTDERANLLLCDLPEPSPFTHVEGKILFPVREGGPLFTGFIDLLEDAPGELVEITDHKSTSDLKWAKTAYELASNVQLMSYAYWAFKYPFKDERELKVTHNVVSTTGKPIQRTTSAIVNRDHVEARWAEHLKIIDEAEEVRKLEDVRKVEARGIENGECQKFSGCPFAGPCGAAQFGQEVTRYCEEESEPVFNPPDAPPAGEEAKEPVSNKLSVLEKLRAKNAAKSKMPKSEYDAKKREEKEAKAQEAAPEETKADGSVKERKAAAIEDGKEKVKAAAVKKRASRAKPKGDVDLAELAGMLLSTHSVTSVHVSAGKRATIQLGVGQ